jgi:hypothetical protein
MVSVKKAGYVTTNAVGAGSHIDIGTGFTSSCFEGGRPWNRALDSSTQDLAEADRRRLADLPGLMFEGDVVRPILQLISVD